MRAILIFLISILIISPCYSQQALPLAFPNEISFRGEVAYFQGSPFSGKLIDNKTNKEIGEYREGYKNGLFIERFANGKTKTKRFFKLGKENGLDTEWYSNGQKKSEYQFVSGIIVDGKYTIYLENGQKEKEETYLNGKKTLEVLYKDGFLYEPSVEYFTGGEKKAEGFLKNGLKDGIWTEWYRTGEKKREVIYDSGNQTVLIYENVNLIVDIDDNVYHSVKIGSQIWMTENLGTTKYIDGTSIPNFIDNSASKNLISGAYFNYDNIQSNSTKYGMLYNWHSVNKGKLCPKGWHVPSDVEWTTLTNYLGGKKIAGGALKEFVTENRDISSFSVSTSSGFKAVMGGYREYDGGFYAIELGGFWWSSTESSSNRAFGRYVRYDSSILDTDDSDKLNGYSVRCIKD